MFTKLTSRRLARPALAASAAAVVVVGALLANPLSGISAETAKIDHTGGARRVLSDNTEELKSEIKNGNAKNVILLIGDGMGDSEITSARYYQYGAAGRLPGIDALPLTGQYTTYSLIKGSTQPDYVPDSAATGTAWSTGTKTYDNAVGVDTNGSPHATLLELAKQAGLKTGNVTTSELQDATPAVQVAHISARSCYGPTVTSTTCATEALESGGLGSITEQLINTRPDVTLGGGSATFSQVAKAGEWKDKTLLQQATDRGYEIVDSKAGLAAVTSANQTKPVLGLFAAGNMPVRWATIPATVGGAALAAQSCVDNSARPATQPSLSDMTTKAIELLDNEKGFFLQVEGASIDKQDHAADACGQIGETIDLDEAVQVALAFAKKQGNTTVIVTADHAHTSQIVDAAPPATLSVNLRTTEGSDLKIAYGTAAASGSQQHTGSQLRVAGYGPGAANLVGLTDQTDMFFTIRNVLGLPGAQQLDTPAPTPTVTADPSALAATVAPAITGTPTVGRTLTATTGTWNVAGVTTVTQWLRNGVAISGATSATYKVTTADAGKTLSIRVIASKIGAVDGTAFSASTSAVPLVAATIKTSLKGSKLTVTVSGVPSVSGNVSIYSGSTVVARDVALKSGKATISLSKLGKGSKKLKVDYSGSTQLLAKTVNVSVKLK